MLGTSSSSFSKCPPPTEQPPLEYGQVPRQPKKHKLPVASSIPVPVSPANMRTGLNIGATQTTQLNTTSQGKSGHPITQFTSSPSFAFSLNPDLRSLSLTAYSSVGTSTNNTTGFPPAERYLSCTSAPPSAGLPTDLTRHAIVSTDSHGDVQLQDAPEGLETVPPLLLRKAADEENESETMEMESKALGTGCKGGVGSPRQHQWAGLLLTPPIYESVCGQIGHWQYSRSHPPLVCLELYILPQVTKRSLTERPLMEEATPVHNLKATT